MPQEIKMEVLFYFLKFSHALKSEEIICMCVMGYVHVSSRWLWAFVFHGVRTLMCMWWSEDNLSYLSLSAFYIFIFLVLGRDAY